MKYQACLTMRPSAARSSTGDQVALMLAGAGPVGSRAEDASFSEYEVKAAWLLNFARFVNWPTNAFQSPESPIVVGIAGKDPFGRLLEKAFAGKTVKGRSLVVKRMVTDQGTEPVPHPVCRRHGAPSFPGHFGEVTNRGRSDGQRSGGIPRRRRHRQFRPQGEFDSFRNQRAGGAGRRPEDGGQPLESGGLRAGQI